MRRYCLGEGCGEVFCEGELESLGENEVTSELIGETVMEHLRDLDDVAYVRFASVYRNFREAKDFRAALDELSDDDKPVTAAHSIQTSRGSSPIAPGARSKPEPISNTLASRKA